MKTVYFEAFFIEVDHLLTLFLNLQYIDSILRINHHHTLDELNHIFAVLVAHGLELAYHQNNTLGDFVEQLHETHLLVLVAKWTLKRAQPRYKKQ